MAMNNILSLLNGNVQLALTDIQGRTCTVVLVYLALEGHTIHYWVSAGQNARSKVLYTGSLSGDGRAALRDIWLIEPDSNLDPVVLNVEVRNANKAIVDEGVLPLKQSSYADARDSQNQAAAAHKPIQPGKD